MGVEEHEASTFSYYELAKRSVIIVKDVFFCALFPKSLLQRFASLFQSMIIMMSAPCTQEVGRSARSWVNPRMVQCTSLGGCTCAIAGGMHAVCDEHGSHLFKSDGLPAHRPWIHHWKWCRRVDRKSAGRTRRPSTFKCTWYSCTHTMSALFTQRALPFQIISVRLMTPPDFEDRKWVWQKLPALMAENWNACTTCAYLNPTPGFFAPFYYCQFLYPYGQRCSDTNDGRLNEGWSLHTIYICTFCAWLNPEKACSSVLVWDTCTTCILLRCLHRSQYEQPIRQMDYWWSLKERALKTYTVFLHASCISEISIYMRLNYIV